MKYRLKILFSTLLLGTSCLFAQNEEDILRYSNTQMFGTARFEAMAGSFGGLGADISAIQVNPAGMGRYSSSQASISVNSSIVNNAALFNETRTKSGYNKFVLGEIGVVLTNDLSRKQTGRKYSQFTLAYTRLKNFNNFKSYEGKNANSLLDAFARRGQGIAPENIYSALPFTTGLAYDVFALDFDTGSRSYVPRINPNSKTFQRREITTLGGMGEFHIGYSENFRNKLYYGASIGIRRIDYTKKYTHKEELLDTVGTSLRSFDYSYQQRSQGTGVNLKLGVLWIPARHFRVGLAFETPTMIKMEDNWTAYMTSEHVSGKKFVDPALTPKGKFKYRMKTPMKLRGSFAYILGMRGAINVDVEWVNLPRGMLRSYNGEEQYLFTEANRAAENQFRSVVNTRIGVEYMVFRDVYLRGGIAILPQPYKEGFTNITAPNMIYACGLGWENRFMFVDASYRLLKMKTDYYAFGPSQIENRTEWETNTNNIVLTLGFKF